MNKTMRRVVVGQLARLGGCGRCMRISLQVAVAAWVLALAGSLFAPWPWLMPTPAALTLLWLAHIFAFALKTWRAGAAAQARNPSRTLPRRRLLEFALRAAGAAILVSLTLPRRANAQGECDPGWHGCADGRHCCPEGMNFLCLYNDCNNQPNRCYRAVSDEDYKYLQQCCQGLLNC